MTIRELTWEEAADQGYIECILGGDMGIRLPESFVRNFDVKEWGFENGDENVNTVYEGPDEEYYWEAWDEILDQAEYTDRAGKVWRLYQDDSLFAYCVKDGDEHLSINFE